MNTDKIIRRNSVFMVLEGAIFYAALSLIPNETVIAEFLDYTSGSVTMVGLAATMSSLMFYVGQFVCGLFIHRVEKQRPFLSKMAFLSRGLLVLFAVALLVGVKGRAAAWLFILAYGVIFTIDGFTGLCWNQVLARTLPSEKRGQVLSFQQSLCGVIGIFAGFVVQRILLSGIDPMDRYKLIFLLAGGVFVLSACMTLFFMDVPHPSYPDVPVKNPIKYIRELLPLMTRDRGVRNTLISRVIFIFTMISAPVNYKFGQVNGLSEFQLSMLVYMPLIGQILAGVFWGYISNRTNYPFMMLLAQIFGIACALANFAALFLAINGKPVMIALSLAMVLVKFTYVANNAFSMHVLGIVDEEKRANAIVITSLVTAPASFGTTLAGMIADWAFWPVYCIMLAAGIAGLAHTYHYFISKNSPLPESQRMPRRSGGANR